MLTKDIIIKLSNISLINLNAHASISQKEVFLHMFEIIDTVIGILPLKCIISEDRKKNYHQFLIIQISVFVYLTAWLPGENT